MRKLVKLFSVDDHIIQDDLAELQKRIDSLQGENREDERDGSLSLEVEAQIGEDDTNREPEVHSDDQIQAQGPAQNTRSRGCNCCCSSHCGLQFHTLGKMQPYLVSHPNIESCSLIVPKLNFGITTVNEEEEDGIAELCNDPWKLSNVMEILSSINLGV